MISKIGLSGVAARYNLFSGIDKNKNIQAAELQRYASELMY